MGIYEARLEQVIKAQEIMDSIAKDWHKKDNSQLALEFQRVRIGLEMARHGMVDLHAEVVKHRLARKEFQDEIEHLQRDVKYLVTGEEQS
jgi:hypothetical protein